MPRVAESVRTDRLGLTIFLLQRVATRCLAVLWCFDKKLLHCGGLALMCLLSVAEQSPSLFVLSTAKMHASTYPAEHVSSGYLTLTGDPNCAKVCLPFDVMASGTSR